MRINEIIIDPEDSGPAIELTSFDDNNVSPAMADLLIDISGCTTINQLRAVLSVYLPELGDGSVA